MGVWDGGGRRGGVRVCERGGRSVDVGVCEGGGRKGGVGVCEGGGRRGGVGWGCGMGEGGLIIGIRSLACAGPAFQISKHDSPYDFEQGKQATTASSLYVTANNQLSTFHCSRVTGLLCQSTSKIKAGIQ